MSRWEVDNSDAAPTALELPTKLSQPAIEDAHTEVLRSDSSESRISHTAMEMATEGAAHRSPDKTLVTIMEGLLSAPPLKSILRRTAEFTIARLLLSKFRAATQASRTSFMDTLHPLRP